MHLASGDESVAHGGPLVSLLAHDEHDIPLYGMFLAGICHRMPRSSIKRIHGQCRIQSKPDSG